VRVNLHSLLSHHHLPLLLERLVLAERTGSLITARQAFNKSLTGFQLKRHSLSKLYTGTMSAAWLIPRVTTCALHAGRQNPTLGCPCSGILGKKSAYNNVMDLRTLSFFSTHPFSDSTNAKHMLYEWVNLSNLLTLCGLLLTVKRQRTRITNEDISTVHHPKYAWKLGICILDTFACWEKKEGICSFIIAGVGTNAPDIHLTPFYTTRIELIK